jgi:hypothetical protein
MCLSIIGALDELCKHSGQKNPKENIAMAEKKHKNQKVPRLKNLPGQYMKWVFENRP